MTLLFCMIVTSLAALACTPALVSWAPMQKRRITPAKPSTTNSDSDSQSIEFQVQQTQIAVREVDPRQRRLVEVSKIVNESTDVISVYLTSVDGSKLPDFRPGQHLIIERPSAAGATTATRCYTLSNGPKQNTWRITVRRVVASDQSKSVSGWIHRDLRLGDRIRVRGPRGSFTLDKADAKKPVVFVAAGVGITPIASMLHDELSYARLRPKWLFYQVRQWEAAPLLQEMVSLIEKSTLCRAWIAASRSAALKICPSKKVNLLNGKLDSKTMLEAIGTNDVTVFMCGPHEWMVDMRRNLGVLGVPDSQIHDEAFAAPESSPMNPVPNSAISKDPSVKFEVDFELSGRKATFQGEGANLLSLAKEHSIQIPASCRTGNCGTCAVKLLRGTVKYVREPQAEIIDGEILPCICVPTSDIGVQA